ncbi:MAG TPA: hypothetical protein VF231_03330 [Candidatus Limnocylindrales bacterium]
MMGGSGAAVATIRPGAVHAIFDHLAVSLTADGRPGPSRFVFSHYRFRWSDDGTAGDLVFVQTPGNGGGERWLVTDQPALADRWSRRLAPGAWSPAEAAQTPIRGSVEVSQLFDGTARERLSAGGRTIEVELGDLAPPVLASGPAPRLPGADILSVLIEAGSARASVDGRPIVDRPFMNDAWVGWLGRPLSSAVLALGEILIGRD